MKHCHISGTPQCSLHAIFSPEQEPLVLNRTHWCDKLHVAENSTCNSSSLLLPTIKTREEKTLSTHFRRRFAGGFFLHCLHPKKMRNYFHSAKFSFPLSIQLKNGKLLVPTVPMNMRIANCLCSNWWKIIFLLWWETKHFQQLSN